MNRNFKRLVFTGLLFFISISCGAMELKSPIPIDGARWTLETTRGYLNIQNNLMSKEDGSNSYLNHILSFQGILFHSYYREQLLTKAQFNVGSETRTNFLWTNKPDFLHDSDINNRIKCIELDVQKLFPIELSYHQIISPYAGFSYFEHSIENEEKYNFENGKTNMYNSILFGGQYHVRIKKVFTQNFFFSYSPLVFFNYRRSEIQFLNFGFELVTETHPFSVTLFYNQKKAFRQKGNTWFDGIRYNMNNSEFGMSFHLNLY